MDDLVQEFLTETAENLNALDQDIVTLEQNPNDTDLIGRIFRLVHTVKGTCGFLGLPRLEKVAHHSENIMGRYREGSLKVTEASVSVILESFDRIKLIVAGIAATGTEPAGDDSDLIAKLDAIYEGREPAPAAAAPRDEGSAADQDGDDAFIPLKPESCPSPPSGPVKNPVAAHVPATAAAVEEKTLRVSVDVLENLMTTVSELVLSRNQILQILRTQADSPFAAPLQRLNLVVSELQESVMQTRMQPIGNAWSKLPR